MVSQAAVPPLTVIICHHQSRALIARCLDSLKQSKGVTFQTLVITSDPTYVDNWSTLYYVEGGPAHKRNIGVLRSQSHYLVFLDDDVEVSPYCLYTFWRWMEEHPRCGMAFAKIYKMEEGRRDEFDACGNWLTWTGFLWDRASNYLRDT